MKKTKILAIISLIMAIIATAGGICAAVVVVLAESPRTRIVFILITGAFIYGAAWKYKEYKTLCILCEKEKNETNRN